MEYPVTMENKPWGTLYERREGLYTVFYAEGSALPGLHRLWLHGGGQSACLGLLAPRGDRLVLTRRLSRQARSAYPAVIEQVSDRPRREEAPEEAWLAQPDGSLLAPDGRCAIPACFPADSPLAQHIRRIGGREYLVFRLP